MNHYTVDILTPNKVVARNVPAESLLVQTTKGQINILGDHTHIVTSLVTGPLTVFGANEDPDRFFSVTTGICKVLDGKVVVLADAAEESKDINIERARAAVVHAQEMLNEKDGLSDVEVEQYRAKLERAQLRVQMYEFVRSRQM